MNAKHQLNQQVEKYWPKIQTAFREKVGPAALAAAKDDKAMEKLFVCVYKTIPFPIRLFVIKKKTFVKFCFQHRDRFV
ncbi:MAG: hypothetical protein LBB56_05000 [Chitinispirillales bacterium]|jgi:hypothetical protein|nr:hypothetical protein [Chitinispirillales bacterium]